MSKSLDATTRNLVEMGPPGWVAYLGGRPVDPGRVRIVDSNPSTVSADVDRVLRLEDPVPWLWHIELQAARDLLLPTRLHG